MNIEPTTPDIPEDIRERMAADGYKPDMTDMIHARMRYEHLRSKCPKVLPSGWPNQTHGHGFLKEAPFGEISETRISAYSSQHAYRMALYNLLEKRTRLALIDLDKNEAKNLTVSEYCQTRLAILKMDLMYPAIIRILDENSTTHLADFEATDIATLLPTE